MSTPTIFVLLVAFSFAAGAVSWWRFKARLVATDGGEILREATSPAPAAHLTEIKAEASRLGYVPVWSGVVDPLDYAELHVHPANGSLLQMGVTHVLVEPKVLYGLLQPVERRSTGSRPSRSESSSTTAPSPRRSRTHRSGTSATTIPTASPSWTPTA